MCLIDLYANNNECSYSLSFMKSRHPSLPQFFVCCKIFIKSPLHVLYLLQTFIPQFSLGYPILCRSQEYFTLVLIPRPQWVGRRANGGDGGCVDDRGHVAGPEDADGGGGGQRWGGGEAGERDIVQVRYQFCGENNIPVFYIFSYLWCNEIQERRNSTFKIQISSHNHAGQYEEFSLYEMYAVN